MKTDRIVWMYLLAIFQFSDFANGRGYIETNFKNFENYEGKRLDGKCCEKKDFWSWARPQTRGGCSDDCDHSFIICIGNATHSSSMSACEYGQKDIESVGGNKISFNSHVGEETNPVRFPFQQWPGEVKLKIDVMDEDDEFILVDHYEYQYNTRDLRRKLDSPVQNLTLSGRNTRLNVNLRVFCDANFFGTDCSIYCTETDDETGHYNCDPSTGEKICKPGWTGTDCLSNIDDCIGNRCYFGSTCVDGLNFYECACPPGRTGAMCEAEVNECASQPCENGGHCLDASNAFLCECEPGYTGVHCEVELDECFSYPCRNGGTCEDDIGTFSCLCPAGFTGQTCEIDEDECALNPCIHALKCYNIPGTYVCECFSGYTGRNCEADVNECNSRPCENGGLCINKVNGYACRCPAGFEGTNCEKGVDHCSPNYCRNGATCHSGKHTFTCECPPEFTGNVCSDDVDECKRDSFNCTSRGECINTYGSYECECTDGYEGINCELETDECLLETELCDNGGICVDGIGGFKCECLAGFTGSRCELNTDECDSSPCLNSGTCVDEIDGFICLCDIGYIGIQCENRDVLTTQWAITSPSSASAIRMDSYTSTLETESPTSNASATIDMDTSRSTSTLNFTHTTTTASNISMDSPAIAPSSPPPISGTGYKTTMMNRTLPIKATTTSAPFPVEILNKTEDELDIAGNSTVFYDKFLITDLKTSPVAHSDYINLTSTKHPDYHTHDNYTDIFTVNVSLPPEYETYDKEIDFNVTDEDFFQTSGDVYYDYNIFLGGLDPSEYGEQMSGKLDEPDKQKNISTKHFGSGDWDDTISGEMDNDILSGSSGEEGHKSVSTELLDEESGELLGSTYEFGEVYEEGFISESSGYENIEIVSGDELDSSSENILNVNKLADSQFVLELENEESGILGERHQLTEESSGDLHDRLVQRDNSGDYVEIIAVEAEEIAGSGESGFITSNLTMEFGLSSKHTEEDGESGHIQDADETGFDSGEKTPVYLSGESSGVSSGEEEEKDMTYAYLYPVIDTVNRISESDASGEFIQVIEDKSRRYMPEISISDDRLQNSGDDYIYSSSFEMSGDISGETNVERQPFKTYADIDRLDSLVTDTDQTKSKLDLDSSGIETILESGESWNEYLVTDGAVTESGVLDINGERLESASSDTALDGSSLHSTGQTFTDITSGELTETVSVETINVTYFESGDDYIFPPSLDISGDMSGDFSGEIDSEKMLIDTYADTDRLNFQVADTGQNKSEFGLESSGTETISGKDESWNENLVTETAFESGVSGIIQEQHEGFASGISDIAEYSADQTFTDTMSGELDELTSGGTIYVTYFESGKAPFEQDEYMKENPSYKSSGDSIFPSQERNGHLTENMKVSLYMIGEYSGEFSSGLVEDTENLDAAYNTPPESYNTGLLDTILSAELNEEIQKNFMVTTNKRTGEDDATGTFQIEQQSGESGDSKDFNEFVEFSSRGADLFESSGVEEVDLVNKETIFGGTDTGSEIDTVNVSLPSLDDELDGEYIIVTPNDMKDKLKLMNEDPELSSLLENELVSSASNNTYEKSVEGSGEITDHKKIVFDGNYLNLIGKSSGTDLFDSDSSIMEDQDLGSGVSETGSGELFSDRLSQSTFFHPLIENNGTLSSFAPVSSLDTPTTAYETFNLASSIVVKDNSIPKPVNTSPTPTSFSVNPENSRENLTRFMRTTPALVFNYSSTISMNLSSTKEINHTTNPSFVGELQKQTLYDYRYNSTSPKTPYTSTENATVAISTPNAKQQTEVFSEINPTVTALNAGQTRATHSTTKLNKSERTSIADKVKSSVEAFSLKTTTQQTQEGFKPTSSRKTLSNKCLFRNPSQIARCFPKFRIPARRPIFRTTKTLPVTDAKTISSKKSTILFGTLLSMQKTTPATNKLFKESITPLTIMPDESSLPTGGRYVTTTEDKRSSYEIPTQSPSKDAQITLKALNISASLSSSSLPTFTSYQNLITQNNSTLATTEAHEDINTSSTSTYSFLKDMSTKYIIDDLSSSIIDFQQTESTISEEEMTLHTSEVTFLQNMIIDERTQENITTMSHSFSEDKSMIDYPTTHISTTFMPSYQIISSTTAASIPSAVTRGRMSELFHSSLFSNTGQNTTAADALQIPRNSTRPDGFLPRTAGVVHTDYLGAGILSSRLVLPSAKVTHNFSDYVSETQQPPVANFTTEIHTSSIPLLTLPSRPQIQVTRVSSLENTTTTDTTDNLTSIIDFQQTEGTISKEELTLQASEVTFLQNTIINERTQENITTTSHSFSDHKSMIDYSTKHISPTFMPSYQIISSTTAASIPSAVTRGRMSELFHSSLFSNTGQNTTAADASQILRNSTRPDGFLPRTARVVHTDYLGAGILSSQLVLPSAKVTHNFSDYVSETQQPQVANFTTEIHTSSIPLSTLRSHPQIQVTRVSSLENTTTTDTTDYLTSIISDTVDELSIPFSTPTALCESVVPSELCKLPPPPPVIVPLPRNLESFHLSLSSKPAFNEDTEIFSSLQHNETNVSQIIATTSAKLDTSQYSSVSMTLSSALTQSETTVNTPDISYIPTESTHVMMSHLGIAKSQPTLGQSLVDKLLYTSIHRSADEKPIQYSSDVDMSASSRSEIKPSTTIGLTDFTNFSPSTATEIPIMLSSIEPKLIGQQDIEIKDFIKPSIDETPFLKDVSQMAVTVSPTSIQTAISLLFITQDLNSSGSSAITKPVNISSINPPLSSGPFTSLRYSMEDDFSKDSSMIQESEGIFQIRSHSRTNLAQKSMFYVGIKPSSTADSIQTSKVIETYGTISQTSISSFYDENEMLTSNVTFLPSVVQNKDFTNSQLISRTTKATQKVTPATHVYFNFFTRILLPFTQKITPTSQTNPVLDSKTTTTNTTDIYSSETEMLHTTLNFEQEPQINKTLGESLNYTESESYLIKEINITESQTTPNSTYSTTTLSLLTTISTYNTSSPQTSQLNYSARSPQTSDSNYRSSSPQTVQLNYNASSPHTTQLNYRSSSSQTTESSYSISRQQKIQSNYNTVSPQTTQYSYSASSPQTTQSSYSASSPQTTQYSRAASSPPTAQSIYRTSSPQTTQSKIITSSPQTTQLSYGTSSPQTTQSSYSASSPQTTQYSYSTSSPQTTQLSYSASSPQTPQYSYRSSSPPTAQLIYRTSSLQTTQLSYRKNSPQTTQFSYSASSPHTIQLNYRSSSPHTTKSNYNISSQQITQSNYRTASPQTTQSSYSSSSPQTTQSSYSASSSLTSQYNYSTSSPPTVNSPQTSQLNSRSSSPQTTKSNYNISSQQITQSNYSTASPQTTQPSYRTSSPWTTQSSYSARSPQTTLSNKSTSSPNASNYSKSSPPTTELDYRISNPQTIQLNYSTSGPLTTLSNYRTVSPQATQSNYSTRHLQTRQSNYKTSSPQKILLNYSKSSLYPTLSNYSMSKPLKTQSTYSTSSQQTSQSNYSTSRTQTTQSNYSTSGLKTTYSNHSTSIPPTTNSNYSTISPQITQPNYSTSSSQTTQSNYSTSGLKTTYSNYSTSIPPTTHSNYSTISPQTTLSNHSTGSPNTMQSNYSTSSPHTTHLHFSTSSPQTTQSTYSMPTTSLQTTQSTYRTSKPQTTLSTYGTTKSNLETTKSTYSTRSPLTTQSTYSIITTTPQTTQSTHSTYSLGLAQSPYSFSTSSPQKTQSTSSTTSPQKMQSLYSTSRPRTTLSNYRTTSTSLPSSQSINSTGSPQTSQSTDSTASPQTSPSADSLSSAQTMQISDSTTIIFPQTTPPTYSTITPQTKVYFNFFTRILKPKSVTKSSTTPTSTDMSMTKSEKIRARTETLNSSELTTIPQTSANSVQNTKSAQQQLAFSHKMHYNTTVKPANEIKSTPAMLQTYSAIDSSGIPTTSQYDFFTSKIQSSPVMLNKTVHTPTMQSKLQSTAGVQRISNATVSYDRRGMAESPLKTKPGYSSVTPSKTTWMDRYFDILHFTISGKSTVTSTSKPAFSEMMQTDSAVESRGTPSTSQNNSFSGNTQKQVILLNETFRQTEKQSTTTPIVSSHSQPMSNTIAPFSGTVKRDQLRPTNLTPSGVTPSMKIWTERYSIISNLNKATEMDSTSETSQKTFTASTSPSDLIAISVHTEQEPQHNDSLQSLELTNINTTRHNTSLPTSASVDSLILSPTSTTDLQELELLHKDDNTTTIYQTLKPLFERFEPWLDAFVELLTTESTPMVIQRVETSNLTTAVLKSNISKFLETSTIPIETTTLSTSTDELLSRIKPTNIHKPQKQDRTKTDRTMKQTTLLTLDNSSSGKTTDKLVSVATLLIRESASPKTNSIVEQRSMASKRTTLPVPTQTTYPKTPFDISYTETLSNSTDAYLDTRLTKESNIRTQRIRLRADSQRKVTKTTTENFTTLMTTPAPTASRFIQATVKRSSIRHIIDLTSNNTYPDPRKEIYEYIQNKQLAKGPAKLTLKQITVTVIRGAESLAEQGKQVVLRTYQRVKNISTSITVTVYKRSRQLFKTALERVEALWKYCETGINHYIVRPLLNARVFVKAKFESAYSRLSETFKRGRLIFESTVDNVGKEAEDYFKSLANYYTDVYKQYSTEVRDIFASLKIPDS